MKRTDPKKETEGSRRSSTTSDTNLEVEEESTTTGSNTFSDGRNQDLHGEEEKASEDSEKEERKHEADTSQRERRLAMNRESARKRRKRQRNLIQHLQQNTSTLALENQTLMRSNDELRSQVNSLQSLVALSVTSMPMAAAGGADVALRHALLSASAMQQPPALSELQELHQLAQMQRASGAGGFVRPGALQQRIPTGADGEILSAAARIEAERRLVVEQAAAQRRAGRSSRTGEAAGRAPEAGRRRSFEEFQGMRNMALSSARNQALGLGGTAEPLHRTRRVRDDQNQSPTDSSSSPVLEASSSGRRSTGEPNSPPPAARRFLDRPVTSRETTSPRNPSAAEKEEGGKTE